MLCIERMVAVWSHSSLWKKAKEFATRAMNEEDRTSPLFPFWCALTLEALARSSLAKVHSSLLADVQKNPDSILYACGISGIKSPKSIPTKVVFMRCKRIIEKFTEGDYKFAMLLMEKRNEELHSGASPFDNWPHADWLTDYFRVCQVLLEFVDKELKELVSEKEAAVAIKMLEASRTNKKDEAFKIIKEKKDLFSKLPVTDRLEKIKKSEELRLHDNRLRHKGKDVNCPACEGSAIIVGEIIKSSNPRDEDGELVQTDILLPEKLHCYSCDLLLDGYDYLQGIGLGETFQMKDVLDPVEYYEIEPTEHIDYREYYDYNEFNDYRD